MKKILSICLMFVFVFSLVAIPVFAQSGGAKDKSRNNLVGVSVKERRQQTKRNILVAADKILNVVSIMNLQVVRLETMINEAKSKGNNVDQPVSDLANMKSKIDSAKSQTLKAIEVVNSPTPSPSDSSDNKTALQTARQLLVAAIKDLNTARQYGRKIIVSLFQIGYGKNRTCISKIECVKAPCNICLEKPEPTCVPRPQCIKAPCDFPNIKNLCPERRVCAQVQTPARNSETKECKVFPTSCLDKGWVVDKTCAPHPTVTVQ